MSENLTPSQLADLFNYLAGLPRRNNRREVVVEGLSVVVLRVWSKRHIRNILEHYCEAELVEAGLIPEFRKVIVRKVPGPKLRIPSRVAEYMRQRGVFL